MRYFLLIIAILMLPVSIMAQEDPLELDCDSVTIEDAEIGASYVVSCPADCGESGSVWGTDIYTDDSRICRAAIHAGVIDAEGGEFTIYYIEGQEEYESSEQNGITSSEWGSWDMSFTFGEVAIEIEWSTVGYELEGEPDDEFLVSCPEDGEPGSLWGTDIYTDDSSICTAAVHMGLIDLDDGGEIVVTFLEGEEEYEGSEENDIESSDWGAWDISFTVSLVDEVVEIDWNTRGYDLEGEVDDVFFVSCPEDGEAGSLWGTDIYTDDSSICTAAAQMGIIDLEDGGEFYVVFLEGEEEYEGSEENDITSSDWGAWDISFTIVEDK